MSTSKKSMLRNITLFLIISSLLSFIIFAQVLDETPPVTTKTYSEPNVSTVLQVPSCNGNVDVNGHFISTATTVTLEATDNQGGSGVDFTSVFIKIPTGCNESEIIEFVGLQDQDIYEDAEECALAVDTNETEEGIQPQQCVSTFWNLTDDFEYDGAFTIREGSIHKICFFSTDNDENEENTQCQVAAVDNSTPVTRKTYGEPNEDGLIEVQSCENGPVNVSGHFISTATTVTLDAEDPEPHPSGVDRTFVAIKVPSGCDGFREYVGLNDSKIYQDSEVCALAVDTNETEEGIQPQQCVSTFWNAINESDYSGPFTVVEESVHKICFFSEDNVSNQEELQCQVVLVDDDAPTINSTGVEHNIIDIESFSGSIGSFSDPACTLIFANVTETHDVEVKFNITGLLQQIFADISDFNSFDAVEFENYLDDRNKFFDQVGSENGFRQFEYEFCPSAHISDLEDEEQGSFGVLSSSDLKKFISEALLLGEFEVGVIVTDEAGKEANTTVNVTIVDLTVPLESGWNIRSTPIELEGDEIWTTGGIDAILNFNSATHLFELVTDLSHVPLRGYYMHATERNQYGIIFERDVTAPPVRTLHEGWNLVGPAQRLFDSSCFGCSKITSLEDESRSARDTFGTVTCDSNGNRGVVVVVSPFQSLSYSNDGSWDLFQPSDIWIPRVREGFCSGDITPSGFSVLNFGGYWAFMQNEALWPGFTTTPLPIDSD